MHYNLFGLAGQTDFLTCPNSREISGRRRALQTRFSRGWAGKICAAGDDRLPGPRIEHDSTASGAATPMLPTDPVRRGGRTLSLPR